MFRANLYQKNIATQIESDSLAIASGFNNALMEITPTLFKVKTSDGVNHEYELQFLEEDFITTTYLGEFENGKKFRLIQPKEISSIGINEMYDALGSFSLGTINPSGWALFFFFTEKNDIRNINITEKGEKEQIQRLIDGCRMAFDAGLVDKFLEFSKRLLVMIEKNPSQLREFRDWLTFVKIMKDGLAFYSAHEQNIIRAI